MSMPPQLIRVKRKRDEETPVQFLQFDAGHKRHRSVNWAYQRRGPTPAPARSDKPVIHVSRPEDASRPAKKHHAVRHSLGSTAGAPPAAEDGSPKATQSEQRRFRVSRSATLSAGKSHGDSAGVSKRERYTTAVFVEGSRKKKTPRLRKRLVALQDMMAQTKAASTTPESAPAAPAQQPQLKRPGVRNKARGEPYDSARAPRALPPSLMNRHTDNMDKIAADMDRWVLDEIGANLQSMERDRVQGQALKFKPKAPAKRFHERHAEPAPAPAVQEPADVVMTDVSDENDVDDDDEWVIEEYVRVPALSIAMSVPASDIGVLEIDDEEDCTLLFGVPPDEDEDEDEDGDEDENAENHYTADYPEDEVDSDDEFGRHAYLYRNGNGSDDEEFDNAYYGSADDDDDDVAGLRRGGGDDDDGARMERIRAFMKRHSAFD